MELLNYVLLGITAIAAVVAYIMFKKRSSAKKLLQEIKARWGRSPVEKYREEDMEVLKGYFDNLKEAETEKIFLDDITWNDLDMDNIFKRVNSTQSTVGEEFLYSLIREPVTDPEQLKERNRLVEFFQSNPGQRIQLQALLAGLGKKRYAGVSNYFFSTAEYKPFRRNKYLLQLAVLFLSPVIMIFSLSTGVLILIASFFYNMTTYYKTKNELAGYLDSMSYMVNLITYSRKISDCDIPEIKDYSERLKKTASKMKGTSIKSFYQIFYNTQDPFFEYIKILFLVELISFESINKKITKHRSELRVLFETVGLLDSLISIASLRESVPFYTVPELYKAGFRKKPGISFKEIYHPLIDEPITNSAEIQKPVLVTGSNASGKSTFLKTVAINAVFAQTVSTCFAKEYESSIFLIFTSMALRDDLQSSESYYIAEIKSLKRILDSLNDQIPLFCVIDEVLRGTNTIERIAASSEVMRYLAGKNCICMTATHDIELVSILESLFDNYHFQESFQGSNIVFDYKLYPGKSKTRNAIKLLEIMGYPDLTVKAARKTAEHFELTGTWTSDA
jgi:DNA mismatch repair ATPase MutS